MTRKKVPQYTFLSLAENRDTFFERIHQLMLPYHDGALLVAKAYQTAKEAFRGIKRKRGERYFEHCRAVALIAIDILGVRDTEVIAALLLHDIVEDCPEWTIEKVKHEFGERVAQLVAALSMPTGVFSSREERQHAYHVQLLAGPPETFKGKLSDRLHNLLTCEALSVDAQWRMIEETEQHYLPIAKERGILYEELKRAIAARKKDLRKNSRTKA